jgi:hypothetical protein
MLQMDEDGFKQTQMGQTSQFGGSIQLAMDYAMRGPVEKFFTNMGSNEGWKNPRASEWSRNFD